ncbi:MAG: phosphotransferase [Rickettsiales bacterium]|nr:phosphotransferase [Pseudomonadota bacterium]MDA0966841.1 phosphotransferase [Pseudomonadota bacterium]MDG4543515.1 phosphotransferase [Rickettsiales bacterium]MDG4545663.1 phosphotransferase [Rickettsiales bacterium]MDG4547564.1 phosphotransferase [Rickettsiales bacterium]
MKNRERLISDYIEKHKLNNAKRIKLSSDASFRSYERLVDGNKTIMLMDAPPEKENISSFVNIDNYLRRRGLSAPEIFDFDEKNGLMLLEDFGNDSFTNVLSGKSDISSEYNELELYQAAIDVLIQLDRSTLPHKTPDYDGELLMKEVMLLPDWYLPHTNPEENTNTVVEEYIAIWDKLLSFTKVSDDVVVLRDYHADNLMWLPERLGVNNVGLLDFQDAVIGSPVYDIVSLLEDARRDVSEQTVEHCTNHYLTNRKSIDKHTFESVYSILAAQRNCKIVGIFARLAVRDNKPRYLNYLPRVWKHLEKGIKHPVLEPLNKWFESVLPADIRKPSAFIISRKEAVVG